MGADNDQQPRRPGRPRGTGAVDPDDILSATLDAIAEGGYQSLSMRAVARTVGVSLATVQHHFGTKAELWQAAVDQYFASAEQRRQADGEQDLAHRILNALDLSSSRPGFLAALLTDRSPGAEERLDYLARRSSELFREPTRLLSDLTEAGHVRPVDIKALQLLLLLGIGSIAGAPDAVQRFQGIDLTDPEQRADLAAALADIIGRGIFSR